MRAAPSRMAASCRDAAVSAARVARTRRRSTIGAGAGEQRDAEHENECAPSCCASSGARAAARSAERDLGVDERAAVRRRNDERVQAGRVRWWCGAAERRAQARPARSRSRWQTCPRGRATAGRLPSACSTTTVPAGRGSPGRARSTTGSIRRRRGPSALWRDEQCRRAVDARRLGRSETRPAHASGAPHPRRRS